MKFALLSIALLITANIVAGGLSYWVPSLDEPGESCEAKRIKIPSRGTHTCIPVNSGICRDNGGKFGEWRFGVDTATAACTSPLPNIAGGTSFLKEIVESTFPVLIDPATTPYPVSGTTYLDAGEKCTEDGESVRGCNYAGTTHVCIGENIDTDHYKYSEERRKLCGKSIVALEYCSRVLHNDIFSSKVTNTTFTFTFFSDSIPCSLSILLQ